MKHDFTWWIFMVGTAGAFAAFIAALVFLFTNAMKKKRGDK
jgi:hypothetical protein